MVALWLHDVLWGLIDVLGFVFGFCGFVSDISGVLQFVWVGGVFVARDFAWGVWVAFGWVWIVVCLFVMNVSWFCY